MITVTNRQILTCPFDEYLKLEGVSFSDIKQEGKEPFVATEKMQLGTKVHNYLLEPEQYRYWDIDIIRPLAVAVKQRIGPLFAYLKPELAVTADFTYGGFVMPYRGRVDLGIPNKIIIDLKVTELKLAKAMEYFDYPFQTSGYALGMNAPVSMIIGIHPKTKQTTLYNIPINQSWWANQIIQRGKAIL